MVWVPSAAWAALGATTPATSEIPAASATVAVSVRTFVTVDFAVMTCPLLGSA